MNREDKLEHLAKKQNPQKIALITGDDFSDILEEKFEVFRKAVDKGLEINQLDDLLEELALIQSFQAEVKALKESISKLELPDDIKVTGIEELSIAVTKLASKKDFTIEKVNIKPIVDAIEVLSNHIDEIKVPPPKQGQEPADYIPMRRVLRSSMGLVYDDSFYTGGGGGGGGGVAPPTMLFQPINQNAAGTTTLVGAQAGLRIKVTNYVIVMGGAGTVQFASDTNNLTGAMSFDANGGVSVGGTEFSPAFQTGVGEALKVTTTTNAGNGHIAYFLASS